MNRTGRFALLCLVVSTAACAAVTASDPLDAILGTWIGQPGQGRGAAGTSIEFRSDGSAIWILGDTFHVDYRHSALGSRHHIDLSGFTVGPLAGRTLYCLGQMPDEDTLRLDCEPGSDPSARPATINDEQVQVFRRD